MFILVFNAGSSSLKVVLYDAVEGQELARGRSDWSGANSQFRWQRFDSATSKTIEIEPSHAAAALQTIDELDDGEVFVSRLAGIGHRVVHGGSLHDSMRIDEHMDQVLEKLAVLAPLHNPPSLSVIRTVRNRLPSVPQVAAFDTAFHATIEADKATYPIPWSWSETLGVRRFGFHGLSHHYCMGRASKMLERSVESLRLIVCHLGHGCSITAIRGGKSVDTTMGFTPMDGLMMATRSGAVDPGILLEVQRSMRLSVESIDDALNRRSGLLGVSGISGDLREVLDAADSGNARAGLAVAIYVHRIKQSIGAMAAVLGGVDALVFTAGVGEHSHVIRKRVCDGLDFLGIDLDPERNENACPDEDLSSRSASCRVLVIATQEEAMIRESVVRVLGLENA